MVPPRSYPVTVNQACCVGLPHAADAVMGLLTPVSTHESYAGVIARVNGTWHDTVLVERRADAGR